MMRGANLSRIITPSVHLHIVRSAKMRKVELLRPSPLLEFYSHPKVKILHITVILIILIVSIQIVPILIILILTVILKIFIIIIYSWEFFPPVTDLISPP